MATPLPAIEPTVVASGRVLFVDATDPEAAAAAAGYARAAGRPPCRQTTPRAGALAPFV